MFFFIIVFLYFFVNRNFYFLPLYNYRLTFAGSLLCQSRSKLIEHKTPSLAKEFCPFMLSSVQIDRLSALNYDIPSYLRIMTPSAHLTFQTKNTANRAYRCLRTQTLFDITHVDPPSYFRY